MLEALRQHGSAAPEQGQLTVEDWVCPEFDALLGSIEKVGCETTTEPLAAAV